jgi:hypothetical protein
MGDRRLPKPVDDGVVPGQSPDFGSSGLYPGRVGNSE